MIYTSGEDEPPQYDAVMYVHKVYNDATGLYVSARTKWGNPALDPYGFIETVSPITNARLISIGAHGVSSRYSRTKFYLEMEAGIAGTVPKSWMDEWEAAVGPVRPTLFYESAAEQVADKLAHAAKGTAEWVFALAIIAIMVNDVYGEVKSGSKRVLNAS